MVHGVRFLLEVYNFWQQFSQRICGAFTFLSTDTKVHTCYEEWTTRTWSRRVTSMPCSGLCLVRRVRKISKSDY